MADGVQDDVASLPDSIPDQPIEADDRYTDDEGYQGNSTSSLLSSIEEEIRAGKMENGRKYANFGQHEYPIPIDDPELDRLDLNHHKYFLLQGDRNQIAPIAPDIQKVLDVGTGSGIWCMDFADKYPSASVIGTDLAPCQPKWVPPNLEFQIDDAEGNWTFEHNSFDYIHMRDLYHGIRDFPRLIRQSYDTLKPGGWYELACVHPEPVANDGSLDPKSCYMELVNTWNELGRRMGIDPDHAKSYKTWVKAQGFEEVKEWRFKVPCSPWARDLRLKKVGAYELINVVDGANGFMLRGWTKEFGMSREDLETLIYGLREELKTNKIHAYISYIVVIGRKPQGRQDENS